MPAKVIVKAINSGNVLGMMIKGTAVGLMESGALMRFDLFRYDLKGKHLLDVGVGTGSMTKILKEKGYDVFGVDVDNSSLYKEITPVVYDGENIPLKTKSQDTGLLICVLHHCRNPLKVLEETMRVCKRIIIIEDTFRNKFEKFLISVRDNVGNFEFFQHEYHTTKDWIKIFKKRGWNPIKTKEWSSVAFYGMYGRQTLFVIERIK